MVDRFGDDGREHDVATGRHLFGANPLETTDMLNLVRDLRRVIGGIKPSRRLRSDIIGALRAEDVPLVADVDEVLTNDKHTCTCALLTARCSLCTANWPLLTVQYPQFTSPDYSQFNVQCSLNTSLIATHNTLFTTHCTLIATHRSLTTTK